MKKLFTLLAMFLTVLGIQAADRQNIRISTDNIDLVLQVGDNHRLYQVYLGNKLATDADFSHFNWKINLVPTAAMAYAGSRLIRAQAVRTSSSRHWPSHTPTATSPPIYIIKAASRKR